MCLITLDWQPDTPVPLRVVANRDEFYARPTLGLHHWPGRRMVAGQDLQAGGTWLGLAVCKKSNRFRLAALTNFRCLSAQMRNAVSRGQITLNFLSGDMGAQSYLQALASNTGQYNPFNLILFDGQSLMGFESRHARAFALPAGISSVSNADFDTPWPKLERLRASFAQTLAAEHDELVLQDQLFTLLADDRTAPEAALPHTGLSLAKERVLSATFIRTPDYGTRASSVVRIANETARFTERRFGAGGFEGETTLLVSLA